MTMGMRYAIKGIIPPKEWIHDKLIRSKYIGTVAEILSYKGIVPPNHWMIT